MGFDDLARRRQAQARAAATSWNRRPRRSCAASRSSMPQPVSIRSRATPSGVRLGADDQLPAVGHRLLGVEHQVQQRAVKRLAVKQHAGQIGRQVRRRSRCRTRSALGRKKSSTRRTCSFRSRRLKLQLADLGEVQKIVQQVLQPLAFALHDGRSWPAPGGRGANRPAPKSSASSSMFRRIVESGFLISCARPPARRGDLACTDRPACWLTSSAIGRWLVSWQWQCR